MYLVPKSGLQLAILFYNKITRQVTLPPTNLLLQGGCHDQKSTDSTQVNCENASLA